MSFFGRRLASRQEAEDLTQETFARLIRAPHMRSASQAYVFTVAANLLRDHARRGKVRHQQAHCGLEEVNERIAETFVDDCDPERVLMAEEQLRLVRQVLEELGERTEAIFMLVRMEQMKQREVARLFGISVSAVEKHLARALGRLAARLDI